MSDFDRFLKIRNSYAMRLPEWMEDYESTGRMAHYPYFHNWDFSPIERNVWGDIRALGLPFYPQIPVLNYFIDFGNPFLKIGIECDGAEFHDADRDRARDADLAAAGWMIFRLKGHECVREIDPDDCEDADGNIRPNELFRFYASTSMGLLTALKFAYFGNIPDGVSTFAVESTLDWHRSTPDAHPVRRPEVASGTQRLSETLDGYMQRLVRRMDKGS